MIEFDRRQRQFGRDVVIDRREPEHLNVQLLGLRLNRLQFLATEPAKPEFERVPDDRLSDGVRVRGELVADRRPDEVGAIGIESLAHQEIDMAEVDEPEVDRDLLAVACPVPQPVNLACHRFTIRVDGIWMTKSDIARGDSVGRSKRA